MVLYSQNVFYDADCLECFLAIGQCDILPELFEKIIISSVVENEILNPGTPSYIKYNYSKLIKKEFVEVKSMTVGSDEHLLYNRLKTNYAFLGNGEAAVIALTCKNGGVIASNNLCDVRGIAEDFDLNLISTAFILAKSYEKSIKSRKELDIIWQDMLTNGRKRSLPKVKTFSEYYDGKYLDDCFYMKLE